MKKKVKKISKYILNFANMINALLISLSQIWNWDIEKISNTIIAFTGIISVYLVGSKLFDIEDIK